MLSRAPDWPERLTACVDEANDRTFAWGTHDCMLWACRVVEMMTGIDLALGVRGTYRTALGAKRVLAKHGGSVLALADAVAKEHGIKRIPPSGAQRGDVVCLPCAPFGEALGVCLGVISVGPGQQGLVRVDTLAARAAWRI